DTPHRRNGIAPRADPLASALRRPAEAYAPCCGVPRDIHWPIRLVVVPVPRSCIIRSNIHPSPEVLHSVRAGLEINDPDLQPPGHGAGGERRVGRRIRKHAGGSIDLPLGAKDALRTVAAGGVRVGAVNAQVLAVGRLAIRATEPLAQREETRLEPAVP